MAITRYEPWGLLSQLQRELERSGAEGSTATAEWAPAVDIKEEADKFVIHADIPGVKPEEIDISMEDGVLTIKGEKEIGSENWRKKAISVLNALMVLFTDVSVCRIQPMRMRYQPLQNMVCWK